MKPNIPNVLFRVYNERVKKVLVFLFPLLLVAAFFASRWIISGAYFGGDLVINTIPLENLHGIIQRSGDSPLWASELAGGYPLLATGQLGYWYPPHMLLRQFLPGVWTLNISLLLHALLAAAGTYILLKHNKISKTASAMGAAFLPLGATIVAKYGSLNLILPFMWVPLLLFFLQLFMEQKKHVYLAGWIGANVLCVLVGHPQMALYVLILEALFIVSFLVFHKEQWRDAVKICFGFLLIIGVSSFYWMPIIDNLPNTDRASGTLVPNSQGMFDHQFTPAAFWNLLLSHPFGHGDTYYGPTNEAELASYFGPGALALVAIGLLFGRKKYPILWRFSFLLVAVGLLLSIGGYSPVFAWMVRSGFTFFNAPARFFLYGHIGLVFFMALGIDIVLSRISGSILKKACIAIIFFAALVPALWVSWDWHDGVPWPFTGEPEMAQILRRESGPVRVVSAQRISGIVSNDDFGIKAWNPLCSTCRYRQTFLSPFNTISGIAVKVSNPEPQSGTITLTLYDGNGRQLRELRITVSGMADSEWSNFVFPQVGGVENKNLYFEITSDMEKQHALHLLIHMNPSEQYDPSGRLYNCTSGNCDPVRDADVAFKILADSPEVLQHDALAPYVSAGYGIGSMQWYGSLPLLDVKEYNKSIGTWGDSFAPDARGMINRFATTHFIGLFPPYRYASTLEGVSFVASIPSGDSFLRLYRNEQAFPRLQFAQAVQAVPDSIDQIHIIRKKSPTDQMFVVADVERDLIFDVGENKAEILQDDRSYVMIQTQQATDGFLVLRDNLLKGWTATIDGVPAKIHRVDGLFRGIFIPAGDHEVLFQYRPQWVVPAIVISGLSFAVLILLVYYSFVRQP